MTPAGLEVGFQLPSRSLSITRADLIRYAGASGDFNPIHWSPETARAAGLPDVIAHGMLTMALAGRVITDWLRDPGALLAYAVRFTRPVVVPAEGVTLLDISAKVASIDPAGRAEIDVKVLVEGKTVLTKARATVRLVPS